MRHRSGPGRVRRRHTTVRAGDHFLGAAIDRAVDAGPDLDRGHHRGADHDQSGHVDHLHHSADHDHIDDDPTTTTTAAKSSSGTSGGTIALIVAIIVAALLIIALILLLLRRRGRAQWREQARGASAEGASLLALLMAGLAALDEPARAARTWSDFEARGAHLHGRLQALATGARDERDGAAVNGVDRDLQSLRSAVEADRGLRLGPPPPTTEQLGYSEAVIRQRTADFEQSLGDLDRYLAEPT